MAAATSIENHTQLRNKRKRDALAINSHQKCYKNQSQTKVYWLDTRAVEVTAKKIKNNHHKHARLASKAASDLFIRKPRLSIITLMMIFH